MNTDEFVQQLPRVARFERPLWAYERLENGWQILRHHLFGATDKLLVQLENLGNQAVSAEWLEMSVQRHHLNRNLIPVLVRVAPHHTAASLAEWYVAWEAEVFERYRQAAWEDYYRHGGGK